MLRIHPLTLGTVDRLTPHARQCVFWETAPSDRVTDREFVKEAWISGVMLEWGVCGLLAEKDDRPSGSALYAPPRLVPRAQYFPAGPVSADAILMTTLDRDPSTTEPGTDVRTDLLAGVVADLRGRGIRAVETFGRSGEAEGCLTETEFLLENGFSIEQDDDHHPRLRLEIETDLMWKADVEKALDQLVAESDIPLTTIRELAGTNARARSRLANRVRAGTVNRCDAAVRN